MPANIPYFKRAKKFIDIRTCRKIKMSPRFSPIEWVVGEVDIMVDCEKEIIRINPR